VHRAIDPARQSPALRGEQAVGERGVKRLKHLIACGGEAHGSSPADVWWYIHPARDPSAFCLFRPPYLPLSAPNPSPSRGEGEKA
jgi:hypothetical protein